MAERGGESRNRRCAASTECGHLSRVAELMPVDWFSTSIILAGSSPALMPSVMPSAVTAMADGAEQIVDQLHRLAGAGRLAHVEDLAEMLEDRLDLWPRRFRPARHQRKLALPRAGLTPPETGASKLAMPLAAESPRKGAGPWPGRRSRDRRPSSPHLPSATPSGAQQHLMDDVGHRQADADNLGLMSATSSALERSSRALPRPWRRSPHRDVMHDHGRQPRSASSRPAMPAPMRPRPMKADGASYQIANRC